MNPSDKSLWEVLWDHDPNGLVVVDEAMRIQVVNPAICRMFRVEAASVLGREASELLGEVEDLEEVLRSGEPIYAREKNFSALDLHVRQVIFAVRERGMVACINVDLSHEHEKQVERNRLKQETIDHVHRVVDNQMKVAQEIASLLGETTAETKASLLKLIRAIEVEM